MLALWSNTTLQLCFMSQHSQVNLFPFIIFTEPWKYPKYMLIGAFAFSFYDYQRRIWLETLMKYEEKLIRTSNKLLIHYNIREILIP